MNLIKALKAKEYPYTLAGIGIFAALFVTVLSVVPATNRPVVSLILMAATWLPFIIAITSLNKSQNHSAAKKGFFLLIGAAYGICLSGIFFVQDAPFWPLRMLIATLLMLALTDFLFTKKLGLNQPTHG